MNDARNEAERVVRTLREAGHMAYFAGGCVRDELLGLEPDDYDVATDAPPQRVEELFKNTRAVGKSFGVVLVRRRRIVTEVATFREEGVYSDRRRPDQVRFADARADAQRRDFTINALFLDPLEEDPQRRVIDFVGGREDLERRVIRAVGRPEDRLAEDHLRALRAVRFASRFGFAIDERTAAAITAHATGLEGVSRERVGDELRRMLSADGRPQAVRWMQRLGLDAPVLQEGAMPGASTVALEALAPEDGPVEALAAWHLDRSAARQEAWERGGARPVVKRLRHALVLANEECEALADVLDGGATLRDGWSEAGTARRKRWAASAWCDASLRLLGARAGDAERSIRASIAVLRETPSGLRPDPLVTGDDLIAEGFTPGPAFGTWLEALYDRQLEDRLASREEALALATRWAKASETSE